VPSARCLRNAQGLGNLQHAPQLTQTPLRFWETGSTEVKVLLVLAVQLFSLTSAIILLAVIFSFKAKSMIEPRHFAATQNSNDQEGDHRFIRKSFERQFTRAKQPVTRRINCQTRIVPKTAPVEYTKYPKLQNKQKKRLFNRKSYSNEKDILCKVAGSFTYPDVNKSLLAIALVPCPYPQTVLEYVRIVCVNSPHRSGKLQLY
jgi:hypothetical protein